MIKANKIKASKEELHRLFRYEDGRLYNKIFRGPRAPVGQEAGTINTKGPNERYRKLTINGKRYGANRIVWKMFNGEPSLDLQIDHINGNTLDDRIENLRLVTNQENQFNQTKTKGYYWHKSHNKWQAKIVLNQKQKHLGSFNTKDEAREAYLEAKEENHRILDRS
jgi:hypothetical protein